MGLSMVLLVAVLLEVGLLCRPFEYNWNKYIPGTCEDSTQAYEAVGILNLITDLTIVILPMPVLWKLQLPVAKKVALTFMFGVGVLICIVSTIRILSLSVWQTSDFTYGMRQIAYWSLLEPTLGIINCCLPIMGPIISAATSSKLWTRGNPSRGKVSYGQGQSGKADSRGGQNLEAGPFKRLNEPSYTMGPMPSRSNEITTSSNSTDFYDPRDDKAQAFEHDPKALPAKPGIQVKQEWQVHHG
uniref:Rhodopsin domain-containing protein n=1 Tax=Cladonia uncialis subsp. uncialis TaxID=180999 RepID=A0A1Z1C488_CLAUC|nr:hypothetical protein [Cladonia uncialis subsp. uncialis]AUW31253.1 hypothetical protein [Cladonia uncialis subsp. uncialis]